MISAIVFLLFLTTLSAQAVDSSSASASLVITQSQPESSSSPTVNKLKDVFTISAATLSTYAWINEGQVAQPVKAIAIDIQGLNGGHGYKTVPESGDIALGKRNVLVIRPYSGPWNWMSFETIKEIDKIIAAAMEQYSLPSNIPLVVFGRSMGGVGATNFIRFSRYRDRVKACAMNSPVTDLEFHSTERPDCAATIYRAYSYYDCPIELAVKIHSPMNFIEEMPDIPYFIVHGDADKAVNKAAHSDKYVPAMRAKGYNVTYVEVPGMEHVDLAGNPEARQLYLDFIASFAK
jgi:pimeloyl-ACP methyl ester carboxylesterase